MRYWSENNKDGKQGDMMRYWSGKNKDGQLTTESHSSWEDVKDELKSLSLISSDHKVEGKSLTIKLPDNAEYIQGKTASANLGGGESKLHSRYIGIVLGNNIVKIRLLEHDNTLSIEVGDIDDIL